MRRSLLLSSLGISIAFSLAAPAMAAASPDDKPVGKTVAAEAKPAAPAPKVHEVGIGDSLSSIAEAEKLDSWRPLWDANTEVQNPDLVYAGQKLVVPAGPVAERPLPAGAVAQQQPVAAAPVYP